MRYKNKRKQHQKSIIKIYIYCIPSSTSHNTVYAIRATHSPKLIPSVATSHTPIPLYEIHSAYVKIKNSDNSIEEKDVLLFIFLK
jgi:hypothetical protein